jgi:hypothetical protein
MTFDGAASTGQDIVVFTPARQTFSTLGVAVAVTEVATDILWDYGNTIDSQINGTWATGRLGLARNEHEEAAGPCGRRWENSFLFFLSKKGRWGKPKLSMAKTEGVPTS